MITDYAEIDALGKRQVREVFTRRIIIQEKVDGSQISFGVSRAGMLFVKSKNQMVDLLKPGMFAPAVDSIRAVKDRLVPEWIYRGEFLRAPKHNVLTYNRAPRGFIVLFDIQDETGQYFLQGAVSQEATGLGFDYAPVFWDSKVPIDASCDIRAFLIGYLDRKSVLGGPIEGVVVKPFACDVIGENGQPQFAKYVSDRFKEKQTGSFIPKKKEQFLIELAAHYRTEARWLKAIQHLRDRGELEGSTKDIGPLLAELWNDLLEDYGEEITNSVIEWSNKIIRKEVQTGFPEFYKDYLAKEALCLPAA